MMLMVQNFAFGVEIKLLKRILARSMSAVGVWTSPGFDCHDVISPECWFRWDYMGQLEHGLYRLSPFWVGINTSGIFGGGANDCAFCFICTLGFDIVIGTIAGALCCIGILRGALMSFAGVYA
eukprot:15366114-Ditylum_brightwellii.AAC.1